MTEPEAQAPQVFACQSKAGKYEAHHWILTRVAIDHVYHTHHECVRCAAQKDVPDSEKAVSRWTRKQQ